QPRAVSASQLTPHPPSATAVACERLSPKLCTTGISLGEAQHNSPWRQPWASGRWMNEPRKDLQAILHNYRGERQGKQFISHPDSFTLPGLVLASPRPTADAVGYHLKPLRGHPS